MHVVSVDLKRSLVIIIIIVNVSSNEPSSNLVSSPTHRRTDLAVPGSTSLTRPI